MRPTTSLWRAAHPKLPRRSARLCLLLATLLCIACSWVGVTSAAAQSVSVQVIGGPLQFIAGTPGGLSFAPVQLTGSNAVANSSPMPFDVSDATGSGDGWRIEATSTQFSDGNGNTLPADATTISLQPATQCDANSNCLPATTNVSYPYTLPAGTDAVATTMFNAVENTGLGNETIAPIFSISLPASVIASDYTATWSFSLVSGP